MQNSSMTQGVFELELSVSMGTMLRNCNLVFKIAVALVLLGGLAGVITFSISKFHQEHKDPRPHIIVFLADDLGFDDVSFHGNDQIPTPNLDSMAADGVILNRHYAAMSGTPSRGALLTAKLPLRIGLNEAPVLDGVYGSGLSLKHKLMPSYLRDLGYETHLIGRWSLGFYKNSLLPTNRGFDSHYGPYSDTGGYYSHLSYQEKWEKFGVPPAYDLHLNGEPDYAGFGKYVTDLYNTRFQTILNNRKKPLFIVFSHMAPHGASPGPLHQGPPQTLKNKNNEADPLPQSSPHSDFDNIKDGRRRAYAGLVKSLDDSFGQAVELLWRNGILNETVILFSSDNGGTTFMDSDFKTGASNWPLRGQKHTQWEGGVRVTSFLWSSLITEPYVSNKLYHFVDWLPTFVSLAGGNTSDIPDVDGKNIWNSIVNVSAPSPRQNILLAYDRDGTENSLGGAAIMGKYKYVSGKWKERNQTNYYLPAGYKKERNYTNLEKMRLTSDVSKVLSAIGRPIKSRSVNWREQATVKCSWGLDLKCNNVPCDMFTETFEGRGEDLEVEVVPMNASYQCDFAHKACLFDLSSDPCEMVNIAEEMPTVLRDMESYIFNSFEIVESTAKLSYNECFDRNSNPARDDPPVWKPWATTCDELLDEKCIKPVQVSNTSSDSCPPGGNVVVD